METSLAPVNTTALLDSDPPDRSLSSIIVIGVVLGIIILVTIFGNLLVCVTVLTDRRMHTPTNLFILSLASTDLCVGLCVLPFSAVNTLHFEWPFGGIFCNIFTSTDVALCTVSILSLFAISIDRYCALSRPLKYQRKMSARIVWVSIACIWAFSVIMGFVPIHFGWNTPDLNVQNRNNVVASLPLLAQQAQVKQINKMTRVGTGIERAMLNGNNHDHSRRGSHMHHKQKMAASDTKAMVTLASIVLAFAVCWVPYFVMFTLKPFLPITYNSHVELFALWLGYFNSAINPFLYAFYNSQFRDAFIRILCRNCPEKKQRLLQFFRERKRKKRKYSAPSQHTSELSVFRQNAT
ncbi:Histamine H2 receptor [Lamellibrachia satsuma]|nr:Histamine H2 receptor [Lamellibrachia satsuma]